jgi:hypothetical protein
MRSKSPGSRGDAGVAVGSGGGVGVGAAGAVAVGADVGAAVGVAAVWVQAATMRSVAKARGTSRYRLSFFIFLS